MEFIAGLSYGIILGFFVFGMIGIYASKNTKKPDPPKYMAGIDPYKAENGNFEWQDDIAVFKKDPDGRWQIIHMPKDDKNDS